MKLYSLSIIFLTNLLVCKGEYLLGGEISSEDSDKDDLDLCKAMIEAEMAKWEEPGYKITRHLAYTKENKQVVRGTLFKMEWTLTTIFECDDEYSSNTICDLKKVGTYIEQCSAKCWKHLPQENKPMEFTEGGHPSCGDSNTPKTS